MEDTSFFWYEGFPSALFINSSEDVKNRVPPLYPVKPYTMVLPSSKPDNEFTLKLIG